MEATLVVPYSIGSTLKKRMQKVEDEFAQVVKAERVRMVEAGGDRLIHVLGRNDPWASETTCGDKSCVPCGSRLWLREAKLEAKKSGTKLPEGLIQKTAPQCRREGCNYMLQCLECLSRGETALYKGELQICKAEAQRACL